MKRKYENIVHLPYSYGPLFAILAVRDGKIVSGSLRLPEEICTMIETAESMRASNPDVEVTIFCGEMNGEDGNQIIWQDGQYTESMLASFEEKGVPVDWQNPDDFWTVLENAMNCEEAA